MKLCKSTVEVLHRSHHDFWIWCARKLKSRKNSSYSKSSTALGGLIWPMAKLTRKGNLFQHVFLKWEMSTFSSIYPKEKSHNIPFCRVNAVVQLCKWQLKFFRVDHFLQQKMRSFSAYFFNSKKVKLIWQAIVAVQFLWEAFLKHHIDRSGVYFPFWKVQHLTGVKEM